MQKSVNITNLESLAASQWGMFTAAQAQDLGVRCNQIMRMVDAGRVEPACYGVYRFCAGEETKSASIKAAWLSVFPKESAADRLKKRPYDAVVAGCTAAYLLNAGDFLSSPYTFAVHQRKQTIREDIAYLLRDVDACDIVFVDDLPTTSFERTVYDLIRSHEDPDHIDKFIQDASRNAGHLFDQERLAELLAPLAARNGFKNKDGASFAADLLSRNSAGAQMVHAAENISHAIQAISGQEEIARCVEQIRALSASLVNSEVFREYNVMAEELRETLADNPAIQNLTETVERCALPDLPEDLPIYSNMVPALDELAELNALKTGDYEDLAALIMADAYRKQMAPENIEDREKEPINAN